MARDLNEYEGPTETDTSEEVRKRIDRSTARALAAAVSALAVTTLVVGTSSGAIVRGGTAVSSDLRSGTITLDDDDGGSSLVEIDKMAPGRPVEECILVTYTGSIVPVVVEMTTDVGGDVAEFVDVEVERGFSGGFGSCTGFVADDTIFEGRLDELADGPIDLGVIRNTGDEIAFRFRFDLADDAEAAGRSGTVDFTWEAEPA